jgi:hypothetical protein
VSRLTASQLAELDDVMDDIAAMLACLENRCLDDDADDETPEPCRRNPDSGKPFPERYWCKSCRLAGRPLP